MGPKLDVLINDFAVRSFRDVADGDYIVARMACRAALVTQFQWSSQQAVEKFLKCILLLNRVRASNMGHDLGVGLKLLGSRLVLDLSATTKKFIDRLNEYGQYRYFEFSTEGFGRDLVNLDRAVWELRRYCTLDPQPQQIKLRKGFAAQRVRIPNGYLEKVIDDVNSPAREPLLWQNGFFGRRARRMVKLRSWFEARNAPLSLNPQILNEVEKYVFLPKEVRAAYRAHTTP